MYEKKLEAMTRRSFLYCAGALISTRGWSEERGRNTNDVAPEIYFPQMARVLDEMAALRAPVNAGDARRLAALAKENTPAAVGAAENILGRYTLATLVMDSEEKGRVVFGGAPKILTEQGWRVFLVRVVNPGGRKESVTLSASPTPFPEGAGRIQPFPSAGWSDHHPPGTDPQLGVHEAAMLIKDMWILAELRETTIKTLGGADIPTIGLSGIPVEYFVIQLFSRDAGRCAAEMRFYTFPENAKLPSIAEVRRFDFQCQRARAVTFGIHDVDGRGCTAALTMKDKVGRIYPPLLMRVVPDRSFHEQVYRADGEVVRLADGVYLIESTRGPEYLPTTQEVTIDASHNRVDVQLQRWIDPARWGWYSGDTHMHANCCVPYRIPEGVTPETMIREVRGEGLAVAEVHMYSLGWAYQAQFFRRSTQSPAATLELPELQKANNTSLVPHPTPEDAESMLHYGIETSVYPADRFGHLLLLRLATLQYPGTASIQDWPSWNLPILRWAKEQGGVTGYGHAGFGLAVASTDLPNYDIPRFDDVGANEVIVDVTHGVVDFLGGCDANPLTELNVWYHLLNCGFRIAFTGESDYPGLTTVRPGLGRSHVRLNQRPIGDVGYDKWVRGIQLGRLYCGDGRSHFLDFKVTGRRNGEDDLVLETPSEVAIEALVAARLEAELSADAGLNVQRDSLAKADANGWHLEKARIGSTRTVYVEVVVNGHAVDKAAFVADGTPRQIQFKIRIAHSSWVALRIYPSSHTHPVFVQVGGKPVRASKRSAEWCRACVDKIWEVKSPSIRESERLAAGEAFDHARKRYEAIVIEAEVG